MEFPRNYDAKPGPSGNHFLDQSIIDDHHAHVCEACYHIFWHMRDRSLSHEARIEQHRCPKCGAGPYKFAYNTVHDAHQVRTVLRGEP